MKLTLTPEAHAQIRELCTSHRGLEVGGVLLGQLTELGGLAWYASGPGPNALLGERTLHWDPAYIAGVLDGAAAGGVLVPIGRWHKHVAPTILPSNDDRAAAHAFRDLFERDTFELIVGTGEGDAPIGFGAYVCRGQHLDRVDLT